MGVLLLSLAASFGASAQTFVCPNGPGPGQRQVGMTGGSPGLAQVPVCVNDGPGAAPAPAPKSHGEMMADFMASEVGFMRYVMEQGRKLVADWAEIQNNPEYREAAKGRWFFASDKQDPRSGKNCTAIFMSPSGVVMISGPTTSDDGALLSLLGLGVPIPTAPRQIRVTLIMDGKEAEARQVGAINFAMPKGVLERWGGLAFNLAGIEPTLAEMNDVAEFMVFIDGKEVIDAYYRDGLQARDRLRQCLAGRPSR
ncbi:MAG: hypothetical protein KIS72_03570 [Luteimonas sp.]|nr:hypothetical protein [Luteimonas sp.]